MKNVEPHIVILGAGFGGVGVYQRLRRQVGNSARISVVNKTNHFLFTPLLHEVATGALDRHHVVEPLRKIVRPPARFIQAEVNGVNVENKTIDLSVGELSYDYLVIALGSTNQFYGIPGADEHACTLKTLSDATIMRNYFIDSFEEASRETDAAKRARCLTFVIVGGGPTGVEVAGEVAELFNDTLGKYYRDVIDLEEVSIHLINSGPTLLRGFHERLQSKAEQVLTREGVHIHAGARVTKVSEAGVHLDDGVCLPTHRVIWAAGVKPQAINITGPVDINPHGRIEVAPTLQIENRTHEFVVGDMAFLRGTDKTPIPMLAQVAVRQAKVAADNIAALINSKPLKQYTYQRLGSLASLGQWSAVAEVKGIRFTGIAAWFIWRTIYLFNFTSWSKRFKIMLDWTINIFQPRDITKL